MDRGRGRMGGGRNVGGGCKGRRRRRHVQGSGDPSLGLGTRESGLGTRGLQGEGVDVARDACVVDETCVVVGVIAAPAVLAAGAGPVCNGRVAVLAARTKSG